MCKLGGIIGVKEDKQDKAITVMKDLGTIISKFNNDGLGHSKMSKDKDIHVEKWIMNDLAWFGKEHIDQQYLDMIQEELSYYSYHSLKKQTLEIGDVYESFGQKVDNFKAMLLHARMATCGGGIVNNHPFVNDIEIPKVSLIHNGVIRNDDLIDPEFKRRYSTCDSEVILWEYIDAKVNENLKNLNAFTKKLRGWFAVMVMGTLEDGTPYIDTFVDGNTSLHHAYVPGLDAFIFSTSGADINNALKKNSLDAPVIERIPGNTAIRWNSFTGEVIEQCTIDTNTKSLYTNSDHIFDDVEDWSWFDAYADDPSMKEFIEEFKDDKEKKA